MRKILYFSFLVIFSTSCFKNRIFVDHDYKYSLKFKDYKTYNFVDCERDSNYICEDVQQAIRSQMSARGYILTNENPSLFINFHVYYDAMKYRGYDQPGMNFWLASEETDETYKKVSYMFNKGTLMISLIEGGTSEIVWRGYAAGIFNKNSLKNSYYKSVVATIFDEYPLFATDEAFRRRNIGKVY